MSNWGNYSVSNDLTNLTVRRGTFDLNTVIIEQPGSLHIMLGTDKANGLLRALVNLMYTESMIEEDTADVLARAGDFTLMSIADARAAQGPDDLAGDDE